MNRLDAWKRVAEARRVVIKVGTFLLTDPESPHGVNRPMIEKLCREVVALRSRGIEVLIVSSGAVGMGRHVLRRRHQLSGGSLDEEPTLPRKQALSAIGQHQLISVYSEIFGREGIAVAQLLFTARDFRDRRAYLNIGHTVQELVSMGVQSIINENDTVSTDELRFGDNDLLSSACTSLFHADLLLILTSVSGFLMAGERVSFLNSVTPAVLAEARGPFGPGTGGMQTKIRAGQLAMRSGSSMVILPGAHPAPISAFFAGEDIGTLMSCRECGSLQARKRWLLYSRCEGAVRVDDGARAALCERGSSLLPAGIAEVSGDFLAGDVVEILDRSGEMLGRGIANYSRREMGPIFGRRSEQLRAEGRLARGDEFIHRNNLILESM